MKKHCPKCNHSMDQMPSLQLLYCAGCNTWWDWILKEGQKSVLIHNHVGKGKSNDPI